MADGIGAKLRAEATRKSAVIALLPVGTRVEILESKGDYARVSIAGKTGKKGWLAKRLLKTKAAPESHAAPQSAPPVRHDEKQMHRNEFALVREEQEKNTWRRLATTIGVAMAAFLGGY